MKVTLFDNKIKEILEWFRQNIEKRFLRGYFGISTSESIEEDKKAIVGGTFELKNGTSIFIQFTKASGPSIKTLTVNDSLALPIKLAGTNQDPTSNMWEAGALIQFVYRDLQLDEDLFDDYQDSSLTYLKDPVWLMLTDNRSGNSIGSLSIEGDAITYTTPAGSSETLEIEDNKVFQTLDLTTNAEIPILARADITQPSGTTGESIYSTDITINPSTGNITANKFKGLADKTQSLFFVVPNESVQTATLTATISGITEYFVGLAIALRMPFGNAANTTLNVNNLGAIPVYYQNNTASANYLVANSVVLLVYETTTRAAGCFKAVYSYNSNTDTKVSQNKDDTSSAEFPVLLKNTSGSSDNPTAVTKYTSKVTIDPSTGNITANYFNGPVKEHTHAPNEIIGTQEHPQFDASLIPDIDANKITGTINISNLPAAALERVHVVADDTARLALTTNDVQNGDTVKVTSTGKMYFVKDDTRLNQEAGYEVYYAGNAVEAHQVENPLIIKNGSTTIATYDGSVEKILEFIEGTDIKLTPTTTGTLTIACSSDLVHKSGTESITGEKTFTQIVHGSIDGNAATATKVGTEDVGSNVKPIYLNKGVATASDADVGDDNIPVYMKDGEILPSSINLNNFAIDSTVVHKTGDEIIEGNKTFKGITYFNNITDVQGNGTRDGAVIVGGISGNHLGFDTNEIQAKSNANTVGDLYINHDGGAVYAEGYTDDYRIAKGASKGSTSIPVYSDSNGKLQQVTSIDSSLYTDTKNTAGATDSSNKLYLIGATSQTANPQTYSQDTAYVDTDGHLYDTGKKVATEEYVGNNIPDITVDSTISGNGNAITAITVDPTDKHKLKLTKGETFIKEGDSRLTDARFPSNDSNLVHKSGTEAITGEKTFTQIIHGSIDGNAATATKVGITTVGSNIKPIYLNKGVATASNADVGSSTVPVYMLDGEIVSTGINLNTLARDDDVVHIEGREIIAGEKTFLNNLYFLYNYLNLNSTSGGAGTGALQFCDSSEDPLGSIWYGRLNNTNYLDLYLNYAKDYYKGARLRLSLTNNNLFSMAYDITEESIAIDLPLNDSSLKIPTTEWVRTATGNTALSAASVQNNLIIKLDSGNTEGTDKFTYNGSSPKTIDITPANIGAAISSHTHGNIQNGGTLQTSDITIASGDKLVVTDSSAGAKIARTSISFDGSTTTKALTQKGTWETFLQTIPDISVSGGTSETGKAIVSLSASGHTITATKGTFLTAHPSITTSNAAADTAASPAHGGNFTIISELTRDTNGHVTGYKTKQINLPSDNNTDTKVTQTKSDDSNTTYSILAMNTANATANKTESSRYSTKVLMNPSSGRVKATEYEGNLIHPLILNVKGTQKFSYNNSADITLNITEGNNITLGGSDGVLQISSSHPSITQGSNTTGDSTPGYNGTFTVVDGITKDNYGHVTAISTKSVKIPASDNTDTKVRQDVGTTDTERPILSRYNINDNTKVANFVVYDTGVTNNPYNHTLTASGGFIGNLTGNADTATTISGVRHSYTIAQNAAKNWYRIANANTHQIDTTKPLHIQFMLRAYNIAAGVAYYNEWFIDAEVFGNNSGIRIFGTSGMPLSQARVLYENTTASVTTSTAPAIDIYLNYVLANDITHVEIEEIYNSGWSFVADGALSASTIPSGYESRAVGVYASGVNNAGYADWATRFNIQRSNITSAITLADNNTYRAQVLYCTNSFIITVPSLNSAACWFWIKNDNTIASGNNITLDPATSVMIDGSNEDITLRPQEYIIIQSRAANSYGIILDGRKNFLDNYVTLNTNQQITGTKEFTNLISGSIDGNAATVTGAAGTSTLAWNSEVTLYTVGGHDIKAKLPTNPNVDEKVKQVKTTTDAEYSILAMNTAAATTDKTETSRYSTGITLNPNTNFITARGFKGDPYGTSFVNSLKDGYALLSNTRSTGFSTIWNAYTRTYKVGGAVYPGATSDSYDNGERVYLAYSITQENVNANANTVNKHISWNAADGSLRADKYIGQLNKYIKIQLNSGTTEGTNQFTYNNTADKTINITPVSIGAATSNHTHPLSIITDSGTSDISLSANTKYKLTAGGSTYIFTTPADTTYNYMSSSELTTGTATTSRVVRADYLKTGVNSLIDTKINALDVTGTSNLAASKTIKAWSETDGKVSITTQDISITKSQISDFSHTHVSNDITSLDANKLTGTINIARLPAAAIETLKIVTDSSARLSLTTSDVQKGDTVKESSTGKMYFVVDDTKLNSEDGYEEYTVGTAAKLGTTNIGSNTKFIYLANGVATPHSGSIGTAAKPIYINSNGDFVQTSYDLSTLNTDTKVQQDVSSTNGEYPLLLCPTSGATTNQGAKTSIFSSDVRVNPSAGNIRSRSIELTGSGSTNGGFIDFHYGGSTADYTSRIIENANKQLTFVTDTLVGPTPALWDTSTKIATTQFVHDNAARHIYANTTIYVTQTAAGTGDGSSVANAMSVASLKKYLATVHMHNNATTSLSNSYTLTLKFIPLANNASYGDFTIDAAKMPGVKNLIIDTSTGINSTLSNYTTNSPKFGHVIVTGAGLYVTLKNLYCTGNIIAEYYGRIVINTFICTTRFLAQRYGFIEIAAGVYNIFNSYQHALFYTDLYAIILVQTSGTEIHFNELCYYNYAIFRSTSRSCIFHNFTNIKLTGVIPVVIRDAGGTAIGTCSTASNTAAKVVTLTGSNTFTLANNATAIFTFDNDNTAENPTLNINNTGAKPIYLGSSIVPKEYLRKTIKYKVTYTSSNDRYTINNVTKYLTDVYYNGFWQGSGSLTAPASGSEFTWEGWTEAKSNSAIYNNVFQGNISGNAATADAVQQYISTSNNNYPILMGATANATANIGKKVTYFSKDILMNPSTGLIFTNSPADDADDKSLATTEWIQAKFMWRNSYERIVGTSNSKKDLNSYTSPGFYTVKTAYTLNCPDGIGIDAVLLVYSWEKAVSQGGGNDSRYVAQELTESAASTYCRRWIRKRNGNDWSTWAQMAFTSSDITGNAATASSLETPVTLWGQSFDGTANVLGNMTSVGSIDHTIGKQDRFIVDNIDLSQTFSSSKESWLIQANRNTADTTHTGSIFQIGAGQITNKKDYYITLRLANPRGGNLPSSSANGESTGNCWSGIGVYYDYELNRGYPYSTGNSQWPYDSDSPNALVTAKWIRNATGNTTLKSNGWSLNRNFYISDNDGTNIGPATLVDGTEDETLTLPATVKATLIGNATSANKLLPMAATALPSGNLTEDGLQLVQVYNNSYPYNYGNVINVQGTNKGAGQLFLGWSGTTNAIANIYYRNKRDAATTWSAWKQIAYTDSEISAYNIINPADSSKDNDIPFAFRALIDESRSNKTAFLPAENITIEYSIDGGSTWVDYGASYDNKRQLFAMNRGFNAVMGKATAGGTSSMNTNCKLRITFNSTGRYAAVDTLYLYCSVSNHTCAIDIEQSKMNAKTTFTTVRSDVKVGGWGGPNVISLPASTFGSYSDNGNGYAYRITYYCTKLGSNTNNYPLIADIRLYGKSSWINPVNMMYHDHIYSWDVDQNVTFPGSVTSSNFFKGKSLELIGTLSSNGGFIDFHYNNSSSDYTSRIIERASGILRVGTGIDLNSNDNSITASGGFVGDLTGNADTATKLATARTLWGQSFDGTANVSGDMSSVGSITFSDVAAGSTRNLLYAKIATNDVFRLQVGGASNAGYVELATADDGNEPIYIRQYKGIFATLQRTATLLDGSGNTSFPGTVTATGGFEGNLTGNADTATKLATARSFTIQDYSGNYSGTATAIDGSEDEILTMPLKATIRNSFRTTAGTPDSTAAKSRIAELLDASNNNSDLAGITFENNTDANMIRFWTYKKGASSYGYTDIYYDTALNKQVLEHSGTLLLTNNTDAKAASDNGVALIIGAKDRTSTAHLIFDRNEIEAKATATTGGALYINNEGHGAVYLEGGNATYRAVKGASIGSSSTPVYSDANGFLQPVTSIDSSLYTNTDTKVKQYVGTSNTERPILSRYNINDNSQVANYAVYDTGVTNNPANHTLTSSGGFIGKLKGTPPTYTSFVDGVKDGNALVSNLNDSSWSTIFNAYTQDYKVAIGTNGSGHNNLRFYSITRANVTNNTNTIQSQMDWNVDTGALSTNKFIVMGKDSAKSFEISNGNYTVNFMVGSGGTNRGLWDQALNKWMIYANASNVYVNGIATQVSKNLILKVNTGTTEGTDLYTYNGSAAKTLDIQEGSNVQLTTSNGVLIISATDTDTKNTAGSTNSSSKLFLVGATSQAANPQTYSDDQVYTTSGTLTSNKVNTKAIIALTGTGTAGADKGSGISPRYIPSLWTFDSGITVANGEVYFIKIPVAGGTYGVWLSLNNGTNYYPVAVSSGTARFTTHYAKDTVIAVTYESAGKCTCYSQAGADSTASVTGIFRVLNDYDANSTYSAMSVSELTTGTAKTSRAVRSDYLKTGINTLIDDKLVNYVALASSQTVTGAKTFSQGPFGTTVAMANAAINLANGNVFTKTITANTTFTITGVPTGAAATFNLILTNGGSKTITWPSSVKWANGDIPDFAASGKDVLTFVTPDGGTTWYGTLAIECAS